MTYYKTAQQALNGPRAIAATCADCGKPLSGPTVVYDFIRNGHDASFIGLHRDCASQVAQILICDSWPHRLD